MDLHKAPCRECTDRKLGCHGSCVKYQEWSKARTKKLAEYRIKNTDANYYHKEKILKTKRRIGYDKFVK